MLYRAALLGFGIVICLAGIPASFAQSSNSRIELSELIRTFMIPRGVSYNILGWDTGSEAETPISWQHAGLERCPAYVIKELGTQFCRTGQATVMVRGKPTHTVLGRVVEPGKWEIILKGPRSGVAFVTLGPGINSQQLGSGLLESASSNAADGFQLSALKSCGVTTSGFRQFRVTALGKEAALAHEEWSCGSAGCSISITLSSDLTSASRLGNCSP